MEIRKRYWHCQQVRHLTHFVGTSPIVLLEPMENPCHFGSFIGGLHLWSPDHLIHYAHRPRTQQQTPMSRKQFHVLQLLFVQEALELNVVPLLLRDLAPGHTKKEYQYSSHHVLCCK